MSRPITVLILCCLMWRTSATGAKLNLPRALLPLPVRGAAPPSISLVVTGNSSCYTWSCSRDDAINVIPVEGPNGCSTSAKVSSVPHLTYRQTAIVFAEDRRTARVLRCDVIVDKIASIEVVTTTRELYVEEAPEAFEVRAQDDQGNEFTSLDGVEFSWTVVSSPGSDQVIRIMKFEESQYEASSALRDLETRGLRGNTALLEGVSTGAAKVIVKLPQPEYSAIRAVEVTIRVVANLLVVPADVSILLRDSVNFDIIQIQEGRSIKLSQPSKRYWLDIEDENIADLNKKTGLAVGTYAGQTKIFLRDASEALDGGSDDVRPPEAIIRVVAPHGLKLELEPKRGSSPWSLQNGESFTLHVHILDDRDRRIHVGPETLVTLELDETLIDVKWRSINGTVLMGKARDIGVVSVVATLMSVAGNPVKPEVTTAGEIQIYSRIKVIPPNVLLPWDPYFNIRQQIQLKAIGGDGTYSWHSDGLAKVDVHTGLVTATGPGEDTVIAQMPSNPYIYGTANVTIVEPMHMEVVWYKAEGAIGSNLPIHIALFSEIPPNSEKYLSFDKCNNMNFKMISMEGIHFDMVTLDDDEDNEEEALKGKACTILWAKCSEIGSGLVVIRVGRLEVTLTLGCFAPIERVYPPSSHSSVLLTVGSSLNIIFTGGPTTWFDGETEIQKELKISNMDVVKSAFYPVTSGSLHVYTVTCLELGESDVHMSIMGNKDKDSSLFSFAEITVRVICSNPAAFKLSIRQNIDMKCPITSQASLLSGGGPVEMEIAALDENGHVFHNASSVRVRWSSKPSTVLPDVPPERFLSRLDQLYNIPIMNYHYEMLTIAGASVLSKSNAIDITMEALGFRGSVLKLAGVRRTPTWSNLPQVSLSLRMVSSVQASTSKIIVYNNPNNIITVPLTHGSGSFQMNLSHDEYIQVALDHVNGRNIKMKPLKDGDVTITVNDLCVNSAPLTIQVRVVSVFNIVADMPELIEKGQSVDCFVRFYDRSGSMLPVRGDNAPALTAKVNEGRISINPTSSEENNEAIVYTVTGLDVGDASIEFTAATARTTSSTHVFAPLRVIPKNSIILPGGSIALKTLGGPPPPAVVKFHKSSKDFDIINVSDSGIVTGNNMGTAGIEACVDGLRSSSVACASANVRVLPLEGVSIYAPTSTLLMGNTMPLWAMGTSDNLSPMELGSLKSSLYFRWSLSGDGSANIHDILSSTGVEFDDSDRVSIRLTAVRTGSISVHLNITSVPGSILSKTCGHTWYARFDVVVLEPLRMINPAMEVTSLLLAPHSAITLETNYQHENVLYSIQEEEKSSEPLVTISPEGKLTTFSRLGRAVLTISTVDSEVWSKQHVTLSLEIRTPHYAMVELSENAALNKLNGLAALPTGLTVPLTMSKYDILGRKFATSTHNIRYLTNRPDLVSVTANVTQSVEVLLSGSGSTVIKIWDPSSEKQFTDYLSLEMQPAIYPEKILATVGDVWCMRSAIKGSRWIESSDGAVWAGSMGLSQARISNVAATSLVLQAPSGLPYAGHASVLTRPIDVMYFLEDTIEHVVTDEKPYTAFLILANHEEYEKYSNVLFDERDCLSDEISYFPFYCDIKHNNDLTGFQISTTAIFDKHRGAYGCQITWTIDHSSNPVISTNYSLSLVAHSGSVSTQPLSIRLIKSPKMQPENIVLSPPPASAASVDILASKEVLNQLKLLPKDDILTVEGPIHLSDTNVRYIIRGDSNSYGPRKAYVSLLSPLTHQKTEIPVNMNGGSSSRDGSCAAGGSSPILQLLQAYQTILLSVVTFIVIIVASVYVYGNIIYPMQVKKKSSILNLNPGLDDSIRNRTYQSRSPLTPRSTSSSSSFTHSPEVSRINSVPDIDLNTSAVYGDPSYFASAERRRNRRFL